MSDQTSHETVGRYRLIRKLARGGMAEVYLARSQGARGFGKTVAIKRILPHFSNDDQFVRMMVDEAKISVLMSHPNIAQIFEFGEADGEYFLVMEYVGGQSLSKLVKRMRKEKQKMNVLDACFIVTELLQGLNSAHTQKNDHGQPAHIIHRDVSPQNVLISWDGHIKVIDFGIARARNRLERTEVGTIKGKLRYLAPEMIDPARFSKTKDFDHRVDIFAAGICLYELVAGALLFSGENELEVYDAIMGAPIPDLAARGLCAPGLMKIIDKALARNPDERYLSAEDFADDLRAHLYRSDPNYKSRRIASLMATYFSREKEILETIEREGAVGKSSVEREVNLTQTAYKVSGSNTSTRQSRSSTRSQNAKKQSVSEKHPVIEGVDGVAPDAETRLGLSSEYSVSQTQVPAEDDDATRAHLPVEADENYTPATSSHDLPDVDKPKKRGVLIAALLGGGLLILLALFAVILWPSDKKPSKDDPALKPTVTAPSLPDKIDGGAEKTNPDAQKVVVVVQAQPIEAAVFKVGEDKAHDSPAVLFAQAGEEIEVRVEAKGYESIRQKVSAPESGQKRVEISLRALPIPLALDVKESGVQLFIDGKAVGKTPSVAPGPHVLRAKKSGYETYEKKFVASAGESVSLSVALKKKRKKVERVGNGTLYIKTTNYWGRVTVDGREYKQTTPVSINLKAGTHKVTVSHPPKKLSKTFTIRIKEGQKTTRTVQW